METTRNNIKYFFLFIVYIIFIIGFIYYANNKKIESYDNSLKNKIKLYNWWYLDDDTYMKKFFKSLLSEEVFDKYKEIHVYSVFGDKYVEKSPENLYIQFSGESNYNKKEDFDINIIPDENYDPNKKSSTVIFPFGYYHILNNNFDMDYFIEKRSLIEKKTRFCLFSVSNGQSFVRNDFFNKLSKYKKVDSCGGYMNSMISEEKCPSDLNEYLKFISQYKFVICFENTSKNNYLTEKIINAYYGGSIPIYWGCKNLSDYVNMSTILHLKTDYEDYEMTNLINEIIRLDNDDEAYNKRYCHEFFKNGVVPDAFDIDKIKERIDDIISFIDS